MPRCVLMNLLKLSLISRAAKPLVSTSRKFSPWKPNPNPLIYRRGSQRSYSDTAISNTAVQRRTTGKDRANMESVLQPYFKQYVYSLPDIISDLNLQDMFGIEWTRWRICSSTVRDPLLRSEPSAHLNKSPQDSVEPLQSNPYLLMTNIARKS